MGLVFLLISESGDITPNTDSSNKIEEMHSHKDFDSGKLVKNILLKHFIQETFNICTVSFCPFVLNIRLEATSNVSFFVPLNSNEYVFL